MLIPVYFSSTLPGYGYGFIAGEAPDGLVRFTGTPGVAQLDLFKRDTRQWLRSTYSAPDGTYRFNAVPVGPEYYVTARDPTETYADMIRGPIVPEAY